MSLVLDASMTLAWQFKRADAAEILLAEKALEYLLSAQATVPAIWYAEVASGVLRGERQGVISATQSVYFLNELSQAEIVADEISPRARQASVLDLARTYGLTVYDATYLELAIRRGAILATFDQKLAAAARTAGVRVFGDPA
ncbi:MAG: type II toxin-antitoxin system VapC family toxin [Terracidiphilus sp.]